VFPSGIRYQGTFAKGLREGMGCLTLCDGEYVGELKNDMIDGKGTFKWLDGKIYVGCWKENKR
jgi:hypothetical protein